MKYALAIQTCKTLAKSAGVLNYVYLIDSEFLVTSEYQKDWLFKAYPGGHTILSVAGHELAKDTGLL
jgi:hypothetical protein